MAVDGAEVGDLLDALGQMADTTQPEPDQDQDRGRGRAAGGGPAGGFESLTPPGGYGRPVAATIQAAAALLGVPAAQVRRAAERVEPYTHNDGSPRWSLMLLERQLSQQPKPRRGTGKGSPWRQENRVSYQRHYGQGPPPAT
jgi:hypothetical protein